MNQIREQDPLKQGLKPAQPEAVEKILNDSRARSIKTRIETSSLPVDSSAVTQIREQDPLKQGLKL